MSGLSIGIRTTRTVPDGTTTAVRLLTVTPPWHWTEEQLSIWADEHLFPGVEKGESVTVEIIDGPDPALIGQSFTWAH